MGGLGRISRQIVRVWVFLYTLGLPSELRAERGHVIDSDVWEQLHDEAGPPAVLLRCLLGVPADLSWRLVAGGSRFDCPIGLVLERSTVMVSRRAAFVLLSVLAGFACALLVVVAVAPAAHSLAYAGGLLVLVALGGWTVEVRATSDADAADAPASSVWPLALALGLAAVALGLVFPWSRGGLIVAVPLVLVAGRAWVGSAVALRSETPATGATALPTPLPAATLASRAAHGDAIAVERTPRPLSRRSVLQGGLWLGLGSSLAVSTGALFNFLWERKPGAFGGVVSVGPADRYPPGSKTKIYEGKFWLVHLDAAQGGPGFLALWQKCPHLGCTVPWRPEAVVVDPNTGDSHKGWFICPCHGSTYNDAGVLVHGPAPRPMDHMAVTIDANTGAIAVDTGSITKGTLDNAAYAVREVARA